MSKSLSESTEDRAEKPLRPASDVISRTLGESAVLIRLHTNKIYELNRLYRTPPQRLSAGGRSKGLVRTTIARRFAKLGFERQRKVNATEFCRGILQTEGPSLWTALGRRATALADLGIVDASLLSKSLGELFAGRRPRESYRIWNTLHLEAWVRSRA